MKTQETLDRTLTLPSDQDTSGRTLGAAEIAALTQVIRSGVLTSTKGSFVKQLEDDFARLVGSSHCHACSSGTAALHTAFAALDPEPGDEFITTPITDMGALTPMLYQGAIPVFADVDPATCNVTAQTIEARLSERTKAIVVTHLFGNPCDMDEIMELARSRNLPVIEDCAQAYLSSWNDRHVGTIGTIGCFSLQQGKHITTGEGGLVVTDDPELARRMFLFINKAWGYGDERPDHYFLALNYRMNELSGACAVGQLPKVEAVVESRIRTANELSAQIGDLRGLQLPQCDAKGIHTYWKYCVNVDGSVIPGGTVALAGKLRDRGIASAPRYIQKPAYACQVFREQRTFGNSRFPFTLARPEAVDYSEKHFPGTLCALQHILVLPWNEKYTTEHVDYIAHAIRSSVNELIEAGND